MPNIADHRTVYNWDWFLLNVSVKLSFLCCLVPLATFYYETSLTKKYDVLHLTKRIRRRHVCRQPPYQFLIFYVLVCFVFLQPSGGFTVVWDTTFRGLLDVFQLQPFEDTFDKNIRLVSKHSMSLEPFSFDFCVLAKFCAWSMAIGSCTVLISNEVLMSKSNSFSKAEILSNFLTMPKHSFDSY